ncbi:hypothetical protein [Candidatus Poriferisodalis multihospitum]|uniref:hypothetical protein n=1 Tax=Candidatus Poriferisodalis multihospitum TaxID=2983191 RepID=UPI002B25F946|nr:hypothetical protein [Candidatus Poriferisodalis multihospitum]
MTVAAQEMWDRIFASGHPLPSGGPDCVLIPMTQPELAESDIEQRFRIAELGFDSLMQADQADRDGAVAELSRLLNSVDTETADAVTAREASLYAFLSLGSPAEAVRKEAEEFFARVRNAAQNAADHQPDGRGNEGHRLPA